MKDEILDSTSNKDYFFERARKEFEKFMDYCEERDMTVGVFNIRYYNGFNYDGPYRYGQEPSLTFNHPTEKIVVEDK